MIFELNKVYLLYNISYQGRRIGTIGKCLILDLKPHYDNNKILYTKVTYININTYEISTSDYLWMDRDEIKQPPASLINKLLKMYQVKTIK